MLHTTHDADTTRAKMVRPDASHLSFHIYHTAVPHDEFERKVERMNFRQVYVNFLRCGGSRCSRRSQCRVPLHCLSAAAYYIL